ncbi:hypothetical protein, partial [Dysgonomonas sp. 521]|uniref:hypothetical protein n=1 Tax=Dysgonomonas sp. 521 TaxID=2302932 RepID=UPI001C888754
KEPPRAERHAWWCERSENEIGGNYFIFLLLDYPRKRLHFFFNSLLINGSVIAVEKYFLCNKETIY